MKIVEVPKKFTFSDREWFYQQIVNSDNELVFCFRQTEYLDSAALGLLLIAKDRCPKTKISLVNVSGAVQKIFEIANFDKLFLIGY